MKKLTTVAVTSRAFSKNDILRKELLSRYPDAKFNDEGEKLEGEALIQFLANCEKVIAGIEKYDETIFKYLPHLKVISRFGVGLDRIDLKLMHQYGLRLGWFPDVNSLSVAELTLGLMLALLRQSFVSAFNLKNAVWARLPGHQLTGKTIGIVGLGHIGKALLRLLAPFYCRVLVYDIVAKPMDGITLVNFDSLLYESDIVTLHVPGTPQTRHLINAEALSRMRKSAFLINTSRGSIVDQAALKKALLEQQIAGAALDVYEEEPPNDLEFLKIPQLICTPHIGGNAYEAELAMGRAAINGLEQTQSPIALGTS